MGIEPAPSAAKSLRLQVDNRRLAANSVQNRGHFLYRFPMRVLSDIAANFKRCACIGMAERPLILGVAPDSSGSGV